MILSIEALTADAERLRLAYALTNDGPGVVFLLNLFEDRDELLKPPPRSKWSAELAPTMYLAHEKTLVVWAGAVPRAAKPGVSYFAPYSPLATKVAAGETYRATLRFETPLLEWNPYDLPSRNPKSVDPTTVAKLRFIVDVVRESDANYKDPSKEQPGAFQVRGHPEHHLAVEAALAPAVTVLRRTDPDFARMVPGEPPRPPNAPPDWKPGR